LEVLAATHGTTVHSLHVSSRINYTGTADTNTI